MIFHDVRKLSYFENTNNPNFFLHEICVKRIVLLGITVYFNKLKSIVSSWGYVNVTLQSLTLIQDTYNIYLLYKIKQGIQEVNSKHITSLV